MIVRNVLTPYESDGGSRNNEVTGWVVFCSWESVQWHMQIQLRGMPASIDTLIKQP